MRMFLKLLVLKGGTIMSEYYNCVPIDKEHAKRIACFSNIYKKIRDRGYTESQIEHDVQYISSQIKLAAQEGMYSLAIPEEFCHCEPEALGAIFSLYDFKYDFDSIRKLLMFEW